MIKVFKINNHTQRIKIILSVFLLFNILVFFFGCGANKNTYISRGDRYYQKGKFDDAIKSYNKAINYKNIDEKIYLKRGKAYFKKGAINKSIEDFSKAIELNNNFTIGYAHRADAFREIGYIDKSIEDYEKLIKFDPLNSKVYVNLGHLWFDGKENFDKAIFYYSEAISINPKELRAYINRGDAFLQKGKLQEAIDDYYSSLEINPNLANVCNNLAWILATSNKSKYRNGFKAVELALKAVKMNPNEYHLSTLSAAYAEIGQFENAIKQLNRAIEISKDQNQIYRFKKQLALFHQNKPWRE